MGKFPEILAKTFVLKNITYTLRYSVLEQQYVFKHNIQNNALHLAAYMGNVELLKAALASPDADMNAPDTAGNTPLHSALLHGHADVVLAILENLKTDKKFMWDLQNKAGETVLHLAAKQKSLMVVEHLLTYQQVKALWQIQGRDKLQPLAVALAQGADNIACYLWENKPKRGGKIGFSDTSKAIEKEMWGFLELIITENPKLALEVSRENKTLLHIAAENNKPKAVGILEKGRELLGRTNTVDVAGWLNAQDKATDSTALQKALFIHNAIAEALLDTYSGFGLSVDVKNTNGVTALHMVSRFEKYASLFLKVLSLSKDLNIIENQGFTPLHYAIGGGFFDAAYILLSRGAKVAGEMQPLTTFAAAQLFIQKDSRLKGLMRVMGLQHANAWDSVNATTQQKDAFFDAVNKGDLKTLQDNYNIPELLHLKNQKGLTALHCAVKKLDFFMVDFLVQNGAPVNACTTQGEMSTLYLAGLELVRALKQENEANSVLAFLILKKILQTPGVIIQGRTKFLELMPKGHKMTTLTENIINAMSLSFLVNNDESEHPTRLGLSTNFGSRVSEDRKNGVDKVVEEAKKLLGLNAPYMDKYRTLLQDAVFKDDRELVTALLAQPDIDPNVQDVEGNTPLHSALLYEKTEIAMLLLAHPAIRVHLKNHKNEYPLHYAPPLGFKLFEQLYNLYPEALYQMNDKAITPFGSLFDGNSVIEDAPRAWLESIDYAKPCVSDNFPLQCVIDREIKNPDIQEIVIKNSPLDAFEKGKRALHMAIHKRNAGLVRAILSRKDLNVNVQDLEGNTALHIACFIGDKEILDILLDHPGVVASIKNSKEQYPLHLSFLSPVAIVKKVFALFPEAANKSDLQNVTPLGYVFSEAGFKTESDRINFLRFYLEQKSVDFCRPCNKGITPLMIAVGGGLSVEVIKALMLKSDVNFTFMDSTALHLAVESKKKEVVSALLEDPNLNINLQNNDGNTALHMALFSGYFDIAELLLRDVRIRADLKNNNGQYPLHSTRGCPVAVLERVFKLYPAAVNSMDAAQITPLGYILGRGWDEKDVCLSFLLNQPETDLRVPCTKGSYPIHLMATGLVTDLYLQRQIRDKSDVNVQNESGLTAFHYAAVSKNVDVMQLLLRAEQPLKVGQLNRKEESALNKIYEALDGVTELADKRVYRYLRDLLIEYHREDLFKDSRKRDLLFKGVKEDPALVGDDYLNIDNVQTIREPQTQYTLLHLAVIHNRIELVEKFNRFNFSMNAMDAKGRTPLHYAALQASPEMLALLLSRQYVNVGLQDVDGKTALDLLPKEHASYQECAALLEQFQIVSDPNNEKPSLMRLALSIINTNESQEEIKALMDVTKKVGINAYISEYYGTALHVAIKYQKHSLLCALIEDKSCDLNVTDGYGRTPLMYAVELGDAVAVSFLTDCDSVAVRHKDESDFTSLHVAVLRDKALQQQLSFVQDGVILKCQIDANMVNVRALLARGANPYFQNEEYKTPFCFALNNPVMAKALLESKYGLDRKALVEACKEYGWLNRVLHVGNLEVLKLLLDIPELLPLLKAVDFEGNTPVHSAFSYVNPEVLALLWNKGKDFIDVDLPNKNGVSLRDVFVQYKGAEMEALWAIIVADLERKRIQTVLEVKALSNKDKLERLKTELLKVTTEGDVEALKYLACPHNKDWKVAGPQLLRDALKISNPEAFKTVVDMFRLSDYVSAALVDEVLGDADLQSALRLFSVIPSGKLKNTLLHKAIQVERLDVLQGHTTAEFLKSYNQHSKTPAECALIMGKRDLCGQLLTMAEQAKVSFLEALPLNAETLKTVIVNGDVDILNAWVKAKGSQKAAKVFAQLDQEGNTALHLACLHQQPNIVKALLKLSNHDALHQPNQAGKTVMQLLVAGYPDIQVPKGWEALPFHKLSFTAQMEKIKTTIAQLTSIDEISSIQEMLGVVDTKKLKKQFSTLLEAALQLKDLTCFNAVVDKLTLKPYVSTRWHQAVASRDPVADRLLPFIQTQSDTKHTVWHQVVLAVQGLDAQDAQQVFGTVQAQFRDLFNRENKVGQTPIALAVQLENWHAVRALLAVATELGYPLVEVLPPTREHLLQVMRAGELALLEQLLNEPQYQEFLQQTDEAGKTPLEVACLSKPLPREMITRLLAFYTYEMVHKPNAAGQTIAKSLALVGVLPKEWEYPPFNAKEVEDFLKRRFEEAMAALQPSQEETPQEKIWGAIKNDNLTDFRAFLTAPEIDLTQMNEAGETPLHAIVHRPEWVQYWLSLNLPTTALDRAGHTGLLKALMLNRKEAALMLAQAQDAPVHVGDPLFCAVKNNHAQVLEVLLQKGADPEHVNGNHTLLEVIKSYPEREHLMAILVEQVKPALLDSWNVLLRMFKEWRSCFNLGVFSKLVKRGVNLNAQDLEGNTALHLSILPASASPDATLMLLEQEDVDVNRRNASNLTPGTLFFSWGSGTFNYLVQSAFSRRHGETKIMPPSNPEPSANLGNH